MAKMTKCPIFQIVKNGFLLQQLSKMDIKMPKNGHFGQYDHMTKKPVQKKDSRSASKLGSPSPRFKQHN
jgi:hypothetical protein